MIYSLNENEINTKSNIITDSNADNSFSDTQLKQANMLQIHKNSNKITALGKEVSVEVAKTAAAKTNRNSIRSFLSPMPGVVVVY